MGLGPERVAGAFEEDESQPSVELCDNHLFLVAAFDFLFCTIFPFFVPTFCTVPTLGN